MPKSVVLYSLLISCPEDVKDEIRIVEECVAEFNSLYSDVLGIAIETKHWRKNSYSQSGGKPQSLLNKQFINNCDAAVAIFWTRFGTPTDEFGSGTEEEIEIMLASEKQVFVYFSDVSLSPSQINSEGYKRILAFKEKYKDKGIYFNYSSCEEFKKLFFAHLSLHFLSEKRVSEVKSERYSELKLVGIDDYQHINDVAHVTDYVPNVKTTKDQFFNIIRSLFHEISEIRLEKRDAFIDHPCNLFDNPVEIKEQDRIVIQEIADRMKIEIDEDFFTLGNLSRNDIIPRYDSVIGTEQEKSKYQKMETLVETIWKCCKWGPIETAFTGKKCLLLALQNCGTAIDEDIEISLKVPHECLITTKDFPEFNEDEKRYLLNDCNIEEMFGIRGSSEYSEYSTSVINRQPLPQVYPQGVFSGGAPNYNDLYDHELADVFCYKVYEDGVYFIIKLKFDYIKHNTIIAFPTVIFVKETFGSIDYSITSKNIAEVVHGTLQVR